MLVGVAREEYEVGRSGRRGVVAAVGDREAQETGVEVLHAGEVPDVDAEMTECEPGFDRHAYLHRSVCVAEK